MDKVIRISDSTVAVLTSNDYGGGWSTAGEDPFDPVVVRAVLDGIRDDLYVTWMPIGAQFTIREYDGREWIETPEDIHWLTA